MSKVRKLAYLIPIAFFGVFLFFIDLERFVAALTETDPRWYAVGVVVFTLSYIPLTARWRILMQSIGYGGSRRQHFEVIAITYGLNKVLPANVGDASRSAVSSMYLDIDEHSEILGLVVFERVIDVLTVGVFVLGATVMLPTRRTDRFLVLAGGLLIGVVILLTIGTMAKARTVARTLLPSSLNTLVENLLFTYNRLSARVVVSVVGYSLVRWTLLVAVFLVLGIAIGLEIPTPVAVLVVGLMSLTTVLPLSPGGIGPVETIGAGTLVLFDFLPETAVTIVFLHRSLGLVLTTLVGFAVHGYRSQARLRT